MMKFIVLSVLLNTGELQAVIPGSTKTEARKRGKGQRGRRRGGGGLR